MGGVFEEDEMNVSVIGTGYVGLVTGACLAEGGHTVMCMDHDAGKIAKLRAGEMPIYEPGLEELVKKNAAAGRLLFADTVAEATKHAEVVFIAVGTRTDGEGGVDMSGVERVGREVAEAMDGYRLLVEKSTVSARTSEKLRRTVLKYLRADTDFDVASNPGFMRKGRAVADTLRPRRVVAGVDGTRAGDLLEAVYRPLLGETGEFLRMDVTSAEMTKHASNAYLALRISFINAVARVCELAGADVEMVARGMGLDERIGGGFLRAGAGYGGACFPRDMEAFTALSEELGYDFRLLKEAQAINREQREVVLKKIKRELWVVEGKRIAVLGLSYKPGTDDVRDAPSVHLVPRLLEMGAEVRVWDPVAEGTFAAACPGGWQAVGDVYECARGADLVVVLTDWPEVKSLDFAKLRDMMGCPAIVDARNALDPTAARAAGFSYHGIGRL